jgi:hypothetical protein
VIILINGYADTAIRNENLADFIRLAKALFSAYLDKSPLSG